MRDITGERYNPAGKGVFVSGPFTIEGTPEVIRLDADINGSMDCYLICRSGSDPDRNLAKLVPGSAISFPDVWPDGPLPSKSELYLKWVFQGDDAVLTRFLLQVTKGV
jgi:hypothetical protein